MFRLHYAVKGAIEKKKGLIALGEHHAYFLVHSTHLIVKVNIMEKCSLCARMHQFSSLATLE